MDGRVRQRRPPARPLQEHARRDGGAVARGKGTHPARVQGGHGRETGTVGHHRCRGHLVVTCRQLQCDRQGKARHAAEQVRRVLHHAGRLLRQPVRPAAIPGRALHVHGQRLQDQAREEGAHHHVAPVQQGEGARRGGEILEGRQDAFLRRISSALISRHRVNPRGSGARQGKVQDVHRVLAKRRADVRHLERTTANVRAGLVGKYRDMG